jgi:hypothetical protein
MKTEIKANDLRVGNLFTPIRGNFISYKMFDKKTPEVVTMTAQGIVDFESGFIEIKPIVLTEELLLKCGFKKQRLITNPIYSIKTKKQQLYFSVFETGESFDHDKPLKEPKKWYSFNENKYYIKIKYFHQLQNLYYALTNEELTINF